MGVCNCFMFCCTLLYAHSSIAIILMGKRELVALLNVSSWCLMMVEWLFLAVPWGCLRFVIVVFPDHTHLLFLASRTHVEFAIKQAFSCVRKLIVPLTIQGDFIFSCSVFEVDRMCACNSFTVYFF